MKFDVNSPGYVLVFAAVVSTLFTGAIMALQAVSEPAAEAARRLYEEKSLVTVFHLGGEEPLSDQRIRELYAEQIRPLDLPLVDPETGAVFNNPDPNAGPLRPRTFVARTAEGDIIGYALPVSGIGFWSQIDAYLAVTPDFETAIGIVVVRHQETPGLGGRITEPKWRQQFEGLKIGQPVEGQYVYIGGDEPGEDSPRHGRHVDAVTGATGTSTAVERFLNTDIERFRRAAQAAGLIRKEGDAQSSAGMSPEAELPIADCGLRIADSPDREQVGLDEASVVRGASGGRPLVRTASIDVSPSISARVLGLRRGIPVLDIEHWTFDIRAVSDHG